ncbi:MAG: hypothetical protein KatS3mg001_112 [Candidatus Pacearchaeota archaeon]|nr:MAG: hypothetical protein KatS3mg001_112 [Candidatus Pacearchaeota archaeon]
MKRGFKNFLNFLVIFVGFLLLIPVVSSEIIFNQQPETVHNLGDKLPISITIKSLQEKSGFLEIRLICDGQESAFYKNPFSISPGEEKKVETTLILEKRFIGELTGNCLIKASLNDEYKLSNPFYISSLIFLEPSFQSNEFNPGQNISISGKATKENKANVNGFIEVSLNDANKTIIKKESTINNGIFKFDFILPKNIKSGFYSLSFYAYEKDINNEITNTGRVDKNIKILQIPTNLELVFETKEVEPGKSLRVKPVLHDQAGDPIASSVFLTIKNSKNKIVEQVEVPTDSFFEFPIKYNEAPSEWSIFALSNKISSESKFKILEKESVDVKIINQTILITNTGNVAYNKTVLVKIANESLDIDVFLDVGETKKYIVTAPEGKYRVEVLTGNVVSSNEVLLTGKIFEVKEAPAKILSLVSHPWVWVFVIVILGFVVLILYRRGYKKAFIGTAPASTLEIPKKRIEKTKVVSANEILNIPMPQTTLIDYKTKAEHVVSIKGEKHLVSLVTLYIKNFNEIKNEKEGVKESINKIIKIAESEKAIIYETGNSIIFILSPIKTKTFKNEERALKLAEEINNSLSYHNKIFKTKLDYGISISKGYIAAKVEAGIFKFADFGSLILNSKRLASSAKNSILLSEEMALSLKDFVKTSQVQTASGVKAYSIKEKKDYDKHSSFIRSFLSRNKEK